MMNLHTISFLEKYKITAAAVTMSFQATGRDEPTILNWGGGGGRCPTLLKLVPYRAAKHRNERENSAAVMSATSSTCRALVTMQTNIYRYTDSFLLLSRCLMITGPK